MTVGLMGFPSVGCFRLFLVVLLILGACLLLCYENERTKDGSKVLLEAIHHNFSTFGGARVAVTDVARAPST